MITPHFRVGTLIWLLYYCDFSYRAMMRVRKSMSFQWACLQRKNWLLVMTFVEWLHLYYIFFCGHGNTEKHRVFSMKTSSCIRGNKNSLRESIIFF